MSQKAHVQTSRNFLYMLPVAVTRSFSDDNTIRYVLLVLWITSFFHIIGQIGQNKDDVIFGRVRQVAASVGGCAVRIGAECAIPDCLVSWLHFYFVTFLLLDGMQ